MNNFPKNLRYLRKKKGLLQTEMQPCLGISRTTWSNYENGKTNPAVEDLVRFSKFFGITLDELILHDLPSENQTALEKKPVKPVLYKTNEMVTVTAEPDISYVLQEIKKLREEVNTIKAKKKKP